MEFTKLKECLYLLDYDINGDDIVIKKLTEYECEFYKKFIDPFKEEFNLNLLKNSTFESKRDLVKYYLFQFLNLQYVYKNHYEIIFTGSRNLLSSGKYEHTNKIGITRKLTLYENYIIINQEIFDCLINEIQECCQIYKIDFFEICEEIDFSTEYFDSGYTSYKQKIKKEGSNTPKLDSIPELEYKKIQNNFDSIDIIDVYNHFKMGLVDKNYLTEQELFKYMTAAFEAKSIPHILFKINDAPKKQNIMKVFYEYYKKIAGKPHGKQKKYASLLGNYFQGYNTENVSSNWSK